MIGPYKSFVSAYPAVYRNAMYGKGAVANTPDMQSAAKQIVAKLRENGFTKETQPHRQALALAEEVGEFVGAYRRWTRQARRTDTESHVIEELADVVITAFVTAAEHGWDLNRAVVKKLGVIHTRGWHEEQTD